MDLKVKTLVWSILNLECLISIFNIDTFELGEKMFDPSIKVTTAGYGNM